MTLAPASGDLQRRRRRRRCGGVAAVGPCRGALALLLACGCAGSRAERAPSGPPPPPEPPAWVHERAFGVGDGEGQRLFGVVRLDRPIRNPKLAREVVLNRGLRLVLEMLGAGVSARVRRSRDRVEGVRGAGTEQVRESRERTNVLFGAYACEGCLRRIEAAWFDPHDAQLWALVEVIPAERGGLLLPPQPPVDLRSNQRVDEAFLLQARAGAKRDDAARGEPLGAAPLN